MVGQEEAAARLAEMSKIQDDVSLGRRSAGDFSEFSFTNPGITRAAVGGVARSAVNMSNKVGRLQNADLIKPLFDKYRQIPKQTPIQRANKSLRAIEAARDERKYTPITERSPEEIEKQAFDIASTGQNLHIAEKLNKVANKDSISKAAATFDLMQRPEGRKFLKKDN